MVYILLFREEICNFKGKNIGIYLKIGIIPSIESNGK